MLVAVKGGESLQLLNACSGLGQIDSDKLRNGYEYGYENGYGNGYGNGYLVDCPKKIDLADEMG